MRRLLPVVLVGLALLAAVPFTGPGDRESPPVAAPMPPRAADTVATVGTAGDAGADADPASAALSAERALADRASAELYDRTCSACHGAVGGEGYTIGPRLLSAAYVASRDERAMARAIRDGVEGSSMMGFGPGRGDLLSEDQVAALVRWLRAQGARAP